MTLDNNECYEFGDYALFPKSRVLMHLNKTINLRSRDFDILLYLVEQAGDLVTDRDLILAVWGEGHQVSDGNITNHISKIRKVLNCDTHSPKFIATYYGKRAYRFIAKVSRTQRTFDHASVADARAGDYTIESNLIAPVFLGQGAYDNSRGPEIETTWTKFKEFKIDNGRLCVFPTGIGVWHLTGIQQFGSFTDVARWRHETYKALLSGKHSIQIYNNEMRVPLISRAADTFASVVGKVEYVFSVMVLHETKWARVGKLRRPLQLLSYLSLLENDVAGRKDGEEVSLERRLLDGTFPVSDIMEFGSPGQDLGFATWDGLSYLEHTGGNSAIKSDIIEFEIAVQSAWWFAKCLYDICLANGPKVKDDLKLPVQDLRWQYAKLQGIVATESAAQRTMIEAILTTSRLHRLVEDTVKIYEQL